MTYEYRCTNGHKHSAIVALSKYRQDRRCPVCREMASRVLSAVPTTFKFFDDSGHKSR